MLMKPKLYYLDAETTDLARDLRLTSFSTDTNELVADYLRWVREHEIDYDHTSYSNIRVARSGKLVATLIQSDDLRYVVIDPVKYTLMENVLFYLGKIFGKELL